MTKILICMCCKDVHSIYSTKSMTDISKNLDVPHEFTYYTGSVIEEARDNAVNELFAGDYTHLMFIDDDILFPKDGIKKLVEMDTDIAAGLYVTKTTKPHLVAWDNFTVKDDKLTAEEITLTQDRYQQVAGVGMGFTLIKREVFENVFKKNHTCFFPKYSAGEDITFCYLAGELGYKIILDKEIELFHLGIYGYSLRDYYRRWGAKNEQS